MHHYLVWSFWRRLCRPRRRPRHSGSQKRCLRIPDTAVWGWSWACTRTWLGPSRQATCWSSLHSAFGSRSPLHQEVRPAWTWAESQGRWSGCEWHCRSRHWRLNVPRDLGGWPCPPVRTDWTALSLCMSHSWRAGAAPQRPSCSTAWEKKRIKKSKFNIHNLNIPNELSRSTHTHFFFLMYTSLLSRASLESDKEAYFILYYSSLKRNALLWTRNRKRCFHAALKWTHIINIMNNISVCVHKLVQTFPFL